MTAILLAFGGSICLGAADFVAGVKVRQLRLAPVLLVSQVAGLVWLVPVVLVKGGIPGDGAFLFYAALAGVGQLIGVAAFWRSLEVGAMGIVAPISASNALLPVAAGLLQGEEPHPFQLLGIVLAISGVVLAAYEPRSSQDSERRLSAGVGFALFAAVGLGLFPIAVNEAAERGTALGAVFVSRAFSCTIIAIAMLLFVRGMTVARRDVPALAAIGALEMTGLFLVAAATTYGLLALVGAISALYPVTTIALAWLVLHERLHRTQRRGAFMAMAGIVAVTAASG